MAWCHKIWWIYLVLLLSTSIFYKIVWLEKEIKNFNKNKLNERKQKLTSHFETFKKIDLLSFFNINVAEVITGFIFRQQYLFEKVIEQREAWRWDSWINTTFTL